jgi:hypothetical protein
MSPYLPFSFKWFPNLYFFKPKINQNRRETFKIRYGKPLQSKFTLLPSKFFPAKIPFTKIQKNGGKNLLSKRVIFTLQRKDGPVTVNFEKFKESWKFLPSSIFSPLQWEPYWQLCVSAKLVKLIGHSIPLFYSSTNLIIFSGTQYGQ